MSMEWHYVNLTGGTGHIDNLQLLCGTLEFYEGFGFLEEFIARLQREVLL